MTTAVLDSKEHEQRLAWWILDALVAEHRCAPAIDTVVFETTSPVGSTHPLYEGVRPRQRARRLECRWVPDPRGEQCRICIWVPRGAEASILNVES